MMPWRAFVLEEDYRTLATDSRRVIFYRQNSDGTGELITGFTATGEAVAEHRTAETAEMASEFRGLLIPREALEALAEVLKPGPSQGEVKRLEEALAVERRRVDEALTGGRS